MSDEEVIELIAEGSREMFQRDLAEVDAQTRISDLGFDSVERLEMFGYIEERLDITLYDSVLAELETVGELCDLVRRELQYGD